MTNYIILRQCRRVGTSQSCGSGVVSGKFLPYICSCFLAPITQKFGPRPIVLGWQLPDLRDSRTWKYTRTSLLSRYRHCVRY
jgi:hypothetical protein